MSHSVFAGAGLVDGIEVWNVEQQLPVKLAAVNGKFSSDTCYIVLVTTGGRAAVSDHSLYIWRGNDCSISESEVVERKAVELKESLNSDGVSINKESQGVESAMFLDIFKPMGGIRVQQSIVSVSSRRREQEMASKGRTVGASSQIGSVQSRRVELPDPQSNQQPPQQQEQLSILKRIIREAIIAFPTDAHLQVLEFFTLSAGMTEEKSLLFRQCWSKVVMGTQAFGRKAANQSGGILNPDLFADELLRELSYADKDIAKLINLSLKYAGGTTTDFSKENTSRINSINNSNSGSNSSTELDNPHEVLKTLQHFSDVDKQLSATVEAIFRPPDIRDSDHAVTTAERRSEDYQHMHTSIAIFRNALKGTKMSFRSTVSRHTATPTTTVGTGYHPLDSRRHGEPELCTGTLIMPKVATPLDQSYGHTVAMTNMTATQQQKELPPYLSTTDLAGVRIGSSQPSHQDRGWTAYQCLSELLACQALNLFPLPVGAQKDPNSLSVTFAFESLPVRPLTSLLGPVLSTYLRKHPSVVTLWCSQLVTAYHALCRHCTSGRLLKPAALSDVYVRENGMLLLGNVAFTSCGSDSERRDSADEFMHLTAELLSSALCLSRWEEVCLRDDDGGGSDGVHGNSGNDSLLNEATLSVVAGGTLELAVHGHNCNTITISQRGEQSVDDGEHALRGDGTRSSSMATHGAASAAPFNSTAVLSVEWESPHYNIVTLSRHPSPQHTEPPPAPAPSSSSSDKNGVNVATPQQHANSVFVHSINPGVVTLTLTAYVSSEGGSVSVSDHHSSNRLSTRRVTATVHVNVIPRYPVPSVDVLELIGYCDEYQRAAMTRAFSESSASSSDGKDDHSYSADPHVILNAQCCSDQSLKRLSDVIYAENSEHRLQQDTYSRPGAVKTKTHQQEWTEIARALERLGAREEKPSAATLTR